MLECQRLGKVGDAGQSVAGRRLAFKFCGGKRQTLTPGSDMTVWHRVGRPCLTLVVFFLSVPVLRSLRPRSLLISSLGLCWSFLLCASVHRSLQPLLTLLVSTSSHDGRRRARSVDAVREQGRHRQVHRAGGLHCRAGPGLDVHEGEPFTPLFTRSSSAGMSSRLSISPPPHGVAPGALRSYSSVAARAI